MSEFDIENIQRRTCNPIIDFSSMAFVSWIEVKGTRYSTKHNMILIVDVEDMPIFVIIKYIFFKSQSEIPFLIGQYFKILEFNDHLQSYEVKNCTHLICISFNNLLVKHSPCIVNTISNGSIYIYIYIFYVLKLCNCIFWFIQFWSCTF